MCAGHKKLLEDCKASEVGGGSIKSVFSLHARSVSGCGEAAGFLELPCKSTCKCQVLVANCQMDTDKIKIYGARVKAG